jgi:hypothetical protein
MKNKFYIFVILLIIVFSGFFLWRMMVSPQYSLRQLEKAMDEQNVTAFNKYVAVDEVVDSIVVQTWEYYTSKEETGSRWSEIRNEIGNTLLSVVKPNLKEIIKKELLDYIATGQWSSSEEEKENNISSIVIQVIKEKIDPEQWDQQSINYTEINGNIAQVGLTYLDKKKEANFLLEVKMRNMNGYWQIIEISNVAQILNMYQNIDNIEG